MTAVLPTLLVVQLNRFKRVVLTWLLLIFLIVPTVANALTIGDASKTYVRQVVSNKLMTLTRERSGYSDDRGTLYYLASLLTLSMWNYEATNQQSLGMTSNTLTPIQQSLDSSVADFNKRYSIADSTSKFTPCSITLSVDMSQYDTAEGLRQYSNKAFPAILSTASDQTKAVLDKLLASYPANGSDDDKKKFLTDNTLTIRAAYNILERAGQERGTILALFNSTSSGDINVSSLTSLLQNTAYQPFFTYAQDLIEKNILSQTNIKLTDSNNDLNKFLTNGGSGEAQVNLAYLACTASSSIYRPFDSKSGEAPFVATLKSIVGDGQDGQDIIDAYNRNKNKVKPLYYREIDSDGKGKGTAKRITVADFMKDIEDSSSGGLLTFKGKFTREADGDSYVFKNGSGSLEYNDNAGSAATGTARTQSQSTDNAVTSSTATTATSTATQSNTATATQDKGGAVLTDDDGNTVTMSDTIENMDLATDFVYTFGRSTPKQTMGKLLMWNILKDYKTDKLDAKYDSQLLYINTFGDIVLADNTVVIPAASNPCILSNDSNIAYNPNTAAFMNSYPKPALGTEMFSFIDRDKSKLIISMLSKSSSNTVKKASDGTSSSDDVYGEHTDIYNELDQNENGPTVKCESSSACYLLGTDNASYAFWSNLGTSVMPLELELYDDGSEKVQTMKAMKYKYQTNSYFHAVVTGNSNNTPLSMTGNRSGNNLVIVPDSGRMLPIGTPKALFPLTDTSDSSFNNVCEYLGKKYFDDITIGSDGSRVDGNERLNVKLMTDLFKCDFNGTANTATLTKNLEQEYTDLNKLGTIETVLASLDQKLLDSVGSVAGVIGLRNAYQDSLWGNILNYTRKFMPFILIAVVVYFVISFVRKRCNLISSTVFIGIAIVLTYTATQILPIYIPIFLNGAISAFSDEVSYKALFMRQESYLNPYDTRPAYDDNGNFSYAQSSINLYRFNDDDLLNVANRYNTTVDNLKAGKAVVLDDQSGLFVEGDLLKMNLDRMFNGLSITGSYNNDGVGNYYTLTSTKHVSNNVDYYCPYYLMVDGFIGKLNKMSNVFNVPPSQLHYGNNLYKDSFIVNSYVKSDLFLNRDNLSAMDTSGNFDEGTSQVVKDEFGENNIDWLGLQDFLAGSSFKTNLSSIKDTLWFKTMVKNGYYDNDGNIINSDKLAKLINHVNNTTQQLLITNSGQLSSLSDENIIKIVSLYATIDFDICISDYTSVVYPQSLNYEEETLEDVLLPVLTKDYDRYIASQRNIVKYIEADFGSPGLIFFMIDIVLAFLITSIMRIVIPILYLCLILAILLRLSLKNDKSISAMFYGFVQIAGGIFFSYLIFCYMTSTSYRFADSSFCLFVLLIVYSVVLTVMLSVLMTFISKLGDFSEIKVSSTLSDIGRKFNKVPGIKQLNAVIGKSITKAIDKSKAKRQRNSSDPRYTFHYGDDVYDEQVFSDIMKNRHGFDSYQPSEGSEKKRRRVSFKRKGVTKDYRYGDDDDSFDKYDL